MTTVVKLRSRVIGNYQARFWRAVEGATSSLTLISGKFFITKNMSSSKCSNPNCSSQSFEIKEVKLGKSKYPYSFVQCSSCGVVVGVIDSRNLVAMLLEQNKAIQKIARALNININLD